MTTSYIGSAPGRLDVLGGVADYSGATVLERPIRATTKVSIAESADATWHVRSGDLQVDVGVELIADSLAASDTAAELSRGLTAVGVASWARYVIGSVALIASEAGADRFPGCRIDVASDVPEGMGVSSSAALEVAAARAACAWLGLEINPVRLAHIAQRAENVVVGAPCGLMDQLTVSCGVPGMLLPISCRPDHVGKPIALPEGLMLVGWPSGHRHAVAGSPYGRARTAAFVARQASRNLFRRPIDHLSALTVDELAELVDRVPSSMTTAEVVAAEWLPDDPQSALNAGESYLVASAARFAVEESARSERALELLQDAANNPAADRRFDSIGSKLGALLRASHDGYSSIGLDSPITDAMVSLLDDLGPASGIFGGRVSGGGSGGTVVVCCTPDGAERLGLAADRHNLPTGPFIA